MSRWRSIARAVKFSVIAVIAVGCIAACSSSADAPARRPVATPLRLNGSAACAGSTCGPAAASAPVASAAPTAPPAPARELPASTTGFGHLPVAKGAVLTVNATFAGSVRNEDPRATNAMEEMQLNKIFTFNIERVSQFIVREKDGDQLVYELGSGFTRPPLNELNGLTASDITLPIDGNRYTTRRSPAGLAILGKSTKRPVSARETKQARDQLALVLAFPESLPREPLSLGQRLSDDTTRAFVSHILPYMGYLAVPGSENAWVTSASLEVMKLLRIDEIDVALLSLDAVLGFSMTGQPVRVTLSGGVGVSMDDGAMLNASIEGELAMERPFTGLSGRFDLNLFGAQGHLAEPASAPPGG